MLKDLQCLILFNQLICRFGQLEVHFLFRKQVYSFLIIFYKFTFFYLNFNELIRCVRVRLGDENLCKMSAGHSRETLLIGRINVKKLHFFKPHMLKFVFL